MDKTEIAALCIVGIMIVMDILTGFAKAVKNHDVSSEKMRDGLWHKISFVMIVALGEILEHGQRVLDMGFSVPIIIPTCVYIVITEVASVLENLSEINPELHDSPILSLFRSSKEGN